MSQKKLTNNQIIEKLRDDKEYFGEYGKQWLSNSDVKNLQPHTFKQFRAIFPNNINLATGNYFHQLILEPKKAEKFPMIDVKIRGSEYKEYLKENNLTFALKTTEAQEIKEMADHFLNRSTQLKELVLNKEAQYEVPMIGKIFDTKFKGKADIVTQGIIVDLKTTSAKTITQFINDGKYKHGYDTQAYIYQELFNKSLTFIAMDKEKKYYNDTAEYYWEIYVCPVHSDTALEAQKKVKIAVEIYNKFYGPKATADIRKEVYNTYF